MAVESVVSFLLGKLDSLLVEEAKLLKDAATEVRRIKYELESMRAFLRDADARAESDARVKTWVKQVREAAYDIEDALDEFVLHQNQAPDEVEGYLAKTSHFIKHWKMRCRITDQIHELRTRIADISSRKANYDLKIIEEQDSSSSNAPSDRVSHLRSTARFVEEADLVGIDNPKNELIGLLVGGESRLGTISIVGMGGLGKTTLAGKVYGSEQVKTHFESCAWVTVSQKFNIEEIFRSMVKKFCEERFKRLVANGEEKLIEELKWEDRMEKGNLIKELKRVDRMGKDELIEELRSYLQQKRYVIALDDLWKVDDWECIKIGFPNGECGSRIMVTTRINEVAAACSQTSGHVYNLPPLPFEQGWALFCRKAFQSYLGGNCPPDLKVLSEKFVRKCGGLPLAIAAIGGLLSTKTKTLVEWQNLYDNLGHQIESSSSLTIMNQILMLSYNDLPYYLKPCFMYVSIFPEDYLIRPMRLIQLWIAEGFVERKDGMTLTLEKVADGYLHELINRSLIQVASDTDYCTIKACRVHDVVREIILSKAREEKFLIYTDGTELSDKTRRLALHCSREIVPNYDLSHLRTFFMLGETWPDSLTNTWFSGFRLLKVLDLEGIKIVKFSSEIANLFHLRFLSLRKTQIRTLPKSIGKLKNLETLDLRDTEIEELPTSIVKLKHLRHLLAGSGSSGYCDPMSGVKVTDGVGSLRSLQQLGFIRTDKLNRVMIRELGMLTQLKWLGISNLSSGDGKDLCASIQKMICLSSLSAASVFDTVDDLHGLLDLKYLVFPPPLLVHLHLRGFLRELPHWIPSLSNLMRLTLEGSLLRENLLSALQHLSNLIKLKLIGSYCGKELCCEGGFQRLKSLVLYQLRELKLVRVEKGAMPNLRKLCIQQCRQLEKTPFGIEHLTHLRELKFGHFADALRKSTERDGGEDHWKISHIPIVIFDGVPVSR